MNKYIIFSGLLVWAVVSKLIGMFWVFACIPFRFYARNTVYNYVLQNDIKLKRLLERRPVWVPNENRWVLTATRPTSHLEGYIQYRKVSRLEYMLVVLLIWGWLDDDSNHDTYDYGHIRRHKLENTWQWKLLGKWFDMSEPHPFGNSWELADARRYIPLFNWVAVLIWNSRNTAYNFAYLWETTANKRRVFYWNKWGIELGYAPDGEVDGVAYWTARFGANW